MLDLAEPYKVKVWHSDGLYTGRGSYSETLLSRGEATFEKVMKRAEDLRLSPNHCPLSCGTAQ